jgi:ribosomal protein L7/L12
VTLASASFLTARRRRQRVVNPRSWRAQQGSGTSGFGNTVRRSIRGVPDSRRGAQRWSWFRAARVSTAAQQEADSRAGELLISLLDEASGRAEVDTLLVQGKYIYAVRRVRELTGLGLADAKRLVDTLEWKSGRRLRPPGGEQLPAEWKAAFQQVSRHRWWRLSLLTVLPAYVAAWFIPALHGWPRTTINGIWSLVLLGLYVDLAISWRRQLKAARDRAQ